MKTRPSVMTHQFSQVPKATIERSSFDRSHGVKTTFDGGYLVPILVDEALPGDTFNTKLTAFARLATPIFPIMDNMFMETFFFAVPIRLIWENWHKFNGAQDNPADSTDFLLPSMKAPIAGYQIHSLEDYLGLPIVQLEFNHTALFHRAYALIWNEWFRDENLQDTIFLNKTDGPDDPSQYVLQRRGKRHDYFTSALPWPQKGESINLPLGQKAPVSGIGIAAVTYTPGPGSIFETGGALTDYSGNVVAATETGRVFFSENPLIPNTPNIYADLSEATSATINQLRQAVQVQKLLERDARGGTRYTEIIKSHFGVTSPDSRLQRPEFLGGGSSPVNITPVPQTASTDLTSPQGNLAATGTVTLHGHGFSKSFTEHSIIIGLVNVRADLTYQNGLNRMWSRQTRFDFYWPALAHIGEQTILVKELHLAGEFDNDSVFGYQERYAEYRYKPSQITGQFRSVAPTPLDSWHLAQDFITTPVLNAEFIEDNPPIDRVIAIPSEPHFIFDGYFSMRCARPMPLYGVPGQMDRF